MKSPASYGFMLAAVLILTCGSTVALSAETPLQPEEKEAAVETLDARINNLQEARDCIDAAKTREAVKACRANIKVAKKNLRELRKASKAARNAKSGETEKLVDGAAKTEPAAP